MLDYKIRELKREIGPRNDAITTLHETVNRMQLEVKVFNRITEQLKLIVNDLRMR